MHVTCIETPGNPRALPAEELAKVWKTYHSNVDVEKNILKAVEETLKMADQKEDVVLAFGSLSFLGEIVKAQKEVRR